MHFCKDELDMITYALISLPVVGGALAFGRNYCYLCWLRISGKNKVESETKGK